MQKRETSQIESRTWLNRTKNTKLLTRSSAIAKDRATHYFSWNFVNCCTALRDQLKMHADDLEDHGNCPILWVIHHFLLVICNNNETCPSFIVSKILPHCSVHDCLWPPEALHFRRQSRDHDHAQAPIAVVCHPKTITWHTVNVYEFDNSSFSRFWHMFVAHLLGLGIPTYTRNLPTLA